MCSQFLSEKCKIYIEKYFLYLGKLHQITEKINIVFVDAHWS
jgi:hypothetical protein